MKPEIYTSVQLLSGESVDILICRGGHISRALAHTGRQKEYDISIFLMQELCLINGKRQEIAFYEGLLIDDYMAIQNVINSVCQSFTQNQ